MKFSPTLLLAIILFISCSKADDSAVIDSETDKDDIAVVDTDNGSDEVDDKDETDGDEGNGTDNESTELTSDQKRLVEEFNYRVFKKSSNNSNQYIRKWKTDINIYLSGSLSSNQREIIKSFVDQLNGISSGFNIKITSNKSDFNTEIYVSSAQDYIKDRSTFIPGFEPKGAYPSGTSRILYEVASNKIYASSIWIENPNDFFVRDVKKEILFSLGLGATEDSTSILYTFFNEVSTLNDDDVFIVKTLSNPLIEAGFNESQVYSVIKNNINSFF